MYVGYGRNNRGRPTCKSSWSGRCKELIAILERRRHDIQVEVIPCSSIGEARGTEEFLIDRLCPEFNKFPHYGGHKGMHTADGIKRIGNAQKNREHSDQEREARRQRMLGNKHLLGHKHSEETKAKLRKASTGRPASELCKQKSSERLRLQNQINPPRKGKKCSEEHRRKLSEAAKRRHSRASKV